MRKFSNILPFTLKDIKQWWMVDLKGREWLVIISSCPGQSWNCFNVTNDLYSSLSILNDINFQQNGKKNQDRDNILLLISQSKTLFSSVCFRLKNHYQCWRHSTNIFFPEQKQFCSYETIYCYCSFQFLFSCPERDGRTLALALVDQLNKQFILIIIILQLLGKVKK